MIRRRVVFTEPADLDVDELFAYIARGNLDAGVRFLDALDKTTRTLARFPAMGKPRRPPRAGLDDVRSRAVAGFANFLVFYRPVERGIEVVRVLHGARDIARAFERE